MRFNAAKFFLHRVLSVELPGTVVFDYPTIGALAEYATALTHHQQPAESASALAPVPAVPRALATSDRSALLLDVYFSTHLLSFGIHIEPGVEVIGTCRDQAFRIRKIRTMQRWSIPSHWQY